MKATEFFKTVILSVLIASVLSAAFTLTGCGEELPMSEQIRNAVDDVNDFLLGIVTENNYTYVSERYDGYLYMRTVDGGTMKVNDNGTVFYFVEESDTYYKICEDGDTWRKTDDLAGFYDTKEIFQRLATRLSGIAWTSYDKKDNALIYQYYDESINLKLHRGELTITYNLTDGITTHTIHSVGTTSVTLPEIIATDTQE